MDDLNLDHFPKSGDIGDIAAVSSDNDLKLAMHRRKIDQHNDEVLDTGYCNFCDAQIDEGKFCPADPEYGSCAADYHREREAKKRNGIK